MPKRTSSYSEWKLEKLSDPDLSVRYLSAVLEDAPECFAAAIGNVARARNIPAISKQAKVRRETIYHSFSKEGNPSWTMLFAVMRALNVKFTGVVQGDGARPRPR